MQLLLLLLLLLLLVFTAPTLLRRLRYGRLSLDDKVVVVTGAGRGIGRRLARQIFDAASRATLVLLDVDSAALASAHASLVGDEGRGHRGNRVLVFECDVSDERAVRACFKQIRESVAPQEIAVLVNNAGIVAGKPLEQLSSAQVRKTFEVNTFAHFWTVQNALPSLKRAKQALIVSVSSVMGMTSSAGLTDYCASKAAVNAFHDSLRLELWRDGHRSIRTLLVCPSAVDTGMFAGISQGNSLLARFGRLAIPMLSEDEVATSILASMLRGDELLIYCSTGWRGLVFPWVPAIARLLPVPLYDALIFLGGGVHGMDTFVGRSQQTKRTSTTRDE